MNDRVLYAREQREALVGVPGGEAGYYTTEVDGVRLVDWLAALLAGETSHVGG